jgi:hypothetical protein
LITAGMTAGGSVVIVVLILRTQAERCALMRDGARRWLSFTAAMKCKW